MIFKRILEAFTFINKQFHFITFKPSQWNKKKIKLTLIMEKKYFSFIYYTKPIISVQKRHTFIPQLKMKTGGTLLPVTFVTSMHNHFNLHFKPIIIACKKSYFMFKATHQHQVSIYRVSLKCTYDRHFQPEPFNKCNWTRC